MDPTTERHALRECGAAVLSALLGKHGKALRRFALACCSIASLTPVLTAHQGQPYLESWSVWWSMNRAAVLGAQPALGAAARAEIAETLHHMVEAPARATDPLLPEALQTWAAFASALPEPERAHARLVCEANLDQVSIAVRQRAATGLALLGGQRAFDLLTDLALDTPRGRTLDGRDGLAVPASVRANAIHGLGLLGAESDDEILRQRIVRVLWDVCESSIQATPEIQRAAVLGMGIVALEQSGSPANLDQETLANGPPTTRDEQLRYLFALLLDTRKIAVLRMLRFHVPRALVLLSEGSPEWRARIVDALLPYATKRGALGIRQMRRAAVLALGSLGDLDGDPQDRAIRAALMDAARNADLMVKCYATLGIGRIGGRPGNGPTRGVGEAELREFLTVDATRGKTQVKPWAALGLGLMEFGLQRADAGRAEPELAELQASFGSIPFLFGKGAYAIALGLARPACAQQVLHDCLQDLDDARERAEIMEALAILHPSGVATTPSARRNWRELLDLVQTRTAPLEFRRSALVKLNRLEGGGETRWNRLFARDLNVLSCGPVVVGSERPGLLDGSKRFQFER